MRKANQILSGCAMAVSYAAFVCWLFCMTHLEIAYTQLSFSPLPLAGYYICIYLFDCILSRKNVPLAFYVFLQFLMGAGALGLFLLTSSMEPLSIGGVIFMGVFLVAGVFGCGYAADEAFTPKKSIFYFDSMVVLLIILILLDHMLELFLVPQVMHLCFAAISLSLFSLISQRTARETDQKTGNATLSGRILVAVLLILILLLSFCLVSIAAGGAQSLSRGLFALIKQIGIGLRNLGTNILALLEHFLTWLLSFLPEEKFDTLESGMETATMEIPTGRSGIPIPKWFWCLVGTAVILWLIKFFLSMRKERVGEENSPKSTVTPTYRSGTLLSALRELLTILRKKAGSLVARIRGRKTAPGLLLWCEKHAPKEICRNPGESGPAFLLRLSALELPPEKKEALVELSQAVEKGFYSPTPTALSPELPKIIRTIKF